VFFGRFEVVPWLNKVEASNRDTSPLLSGLTSVLSGLGEDFG